MRRGVAVLLTIAVAVAAAAGGWLAGRNIKSPDQAALESEPPPASLITVEVERTELIADVIIRADIGYDEPTPLYLSGALGNPTAIQVVTSAPERGAELIEGSVAIEIAGRPVFLLQGSLPVYRDLRPQDRGPDVEQLETVLVRLGYFDGEPDQLWDHDTGAAVRAWYEEAGYRPNEPSESEKFDLNAARDRLNSARAVLDDAQEALSEARKGPTDLQVRQTRTSVAQAEAALAQARRNLSKVTDDARIAVLEARQALEDSQLALTNAKSDLSDAESTRDSAAKGYSGAQLRMQSATDGVHPDSGEVPTAAQQETLRTDVANTKKVLADADRAVENARSAVADATWALTDAEENVANAEADLQALLEPQNAPGSEGAQDPDPAQDPEGAQETDTASVPEGTKSPEAAPEAATDPAQQRARLDTQPLLALQTAENELAAAQKTLADMLAPPDTESEERRLRSARTEFDDAEADLAELELTTGVWLAGGELIVLKRLPVRVDLLTAERGSAVSGAFMTVTGSELAVRGAVSERDIDRVSEGTAVRIEDRSIAEPILGTIRLLDRRAGTRDVAIDRHYVEIVAQGIPDHLIGRNVKIVIPVGGTDGPVLVVPNAALSATASGATRVEVEQPDGTTRFVSVTPGLSTGGRVEVIPIDGELRAGDRVVVGVASGE